MVMPKDEVRTAPVTFDLRAAMDMALQEDLIQSGFDLTDPEVSPSRDHRLTGKSPSRIFTEHQNT